MNNTFGLPVILSSSKIGGGEGGGETGHGSGEGHVGGLKGVKTPFACSFETWSESFRTDDFKDGIIDYNDYGQWWADNGLGEDAWQQFNPDVPFNWQANNR